jgi:hypothetical protein
MSLQGTLDATVDGDVIFRFTVRNNGTSPVALSFRTGQRADVVVTDAETGDEVWQWSRGRMFTQALATEELAPGETLERTLTWSDPPAGRYEAEGSLAAQQDVSATTSLDV